jgi:hypothetical protein
MKWRHAEAWISLTTDTADGFEMEAEFHMHETPTIVALIKGPSLVTPGRKVYHEKISLATKTIKYSLRIVMCLKDGKLPNW